MKKPISGGRYSKNGDTLTLTIAPTGERPCDCRKHAEDKVDSSETEPLLPEPPALEQEQEPSSE